MNSKKKDSSKEKTLHGEHYHNPFRFRRVYQHQYGDKDYKAELPDNGYFYKLEKVKDSYWEALAEEISDVTGYDIDDINEEISMTAKEGRDFV